MLEESVFMNALQARQSVHSYISVLAFRTLPHRGQNTYITSSDTAKCIDGWSHIHRIEGSMICYPPSCARDVVWFHFNKYSHATYISSRVDDKLDGHLQGLLLQIMLMTNYNQGFLCLYHICYAIQVEVLFQTIIVFDYS